MRKSTVVALVLILGFSALGTQAFKKTLTPYVLVPEAQTAGHVVQVYGEIDQGRLEFHEPTGEFRFPLIDDQQNTMMVHYSGARPGNLTQASHCVATGRWNGDHFAATSLLIKCPSKYQGEENA
jgi:cytochrome c-type biogenesis protein CcmE